MMRSKEKKIQTVLNDWIKATTKGNEIATKPNLPRCGDPMPERFEGDGLFRIANLNRHGMDWGDGAEVSPDIEIIKELGINAQGYCKINKPWSAGNKDRFNSMMDVVFDTTTHTAFASAPADHDTRYQPGGCLLTVNGECAGRHAKTGQDPLGRYCWMELKGARDEGVWICTAYRVCQEKRDNPGPLTAYQESMKD